MKTKRNYYSNSFYKGLLFLFFAVLSGNLQAQPPLKAYPMNVFTPPGQPLTIDLTSENELGTCTGTSILIDFLAGPFHGTKTAIVNNQFTYQPTAGYVGRDSLVYQITCGANSSSAVVYINVNDKPDNIFDGCTIDRQAIEWGIVSAQSASKRHSPYQTPVAGDIDHDGLVEVVVATDPIEESPEVNGISIKRPCITLTIYKGIDIINNAPHAVVIHTVKPFQWEGWLKYSLVRTKINVAGNMKDSTLIIVAEGDMRLRAYNYPAGNLVWTSSAVYHPSIYNYPTTYADFNQDGIPEIMIGGKLFDSSTGKLLCSNGTDFPAVLAADLYNDGTLNYVSANMIYDVAPDLTSMTLKRAITPPTITTADPDFSGAAWVVENGGYLSVVDMDHDGKLDLVITKKTDSNVAIYIADPNTGLIKASKYIHRSDISPTLIGDIDGDGNNEIVLIGGNQVTSTLSENRNIFAFKYIPGNPRLQEFWRLDHTDNSGTTGLTLFDFDQDGLAELVYRDEQFIRILDGTLEGATKYEDRNKAIFPCISGTSREYPIVADVDGDGQAEIITVGGEKGDGASTNLLGPLRIFKSSDAINSPWAPARSVWHQQFYNPVYVNEDLTIPAHPINPATFFVGKDGTRRQPFNNYLQQATLLDDEGRPFRYAPNLEFDVSSLQYANQAGTNIDISFTVINSGDANFTGPLRISTYYYNAGTYTLLDSREFTGDIDQGISKAISYTITNLPLGSDPGTHIQIRVNEQNGKFLQPECKYSDNFSRIKFNVPDYSLMCEGDQKALIFHPENMPFIYYWYDRNPITYPSTANVLATGDTYSFTKTAAAVDSLFVRVYDGETNYWHDNEVYKVKIFLTPDSLVWTGNGNNANWNDPANWYYPNNPDPSCTECIPYQIPYTCTHVLIPEGRSHYPDLTPTTSVPTFFPNTSCNHIRFAHGGEVMRTDSLHYTEAYVDLKIESNHWYMLSAPLQNMYTGDFYEKSPNPFYDGFDGKGLFVEPMYFNVKNPQTGKKTASFEWTGTFNGADSLLRAGQGLALWAGDASPLYTHHQDVLFRFPKSDTYYKYYNTNGTETGRVTPTLNRTNKNRFIYEPTINKTTGATYGDVPLYTSPVANPGEPILVGNPFMAHLKFNEFVALNSADIEYEYKLAYGVAPSGDLTDGKVSDFVTYKQVGSTYITTDDSESSEFNDIAPMQSFIVISKNGAPHLKANIKQTETVAGVKLRSASSTSTPDYLLEISSEQNQQPTSKALLLYMENASNDYVPAEDSYKLFPENSLAHVLVYLRSSDGYALDINSIGSLEQAIPLGIRTNQKGVIRLKFEGTDKFLDKANVFLHDTKENKVINMSLYKEYTFNKEEDDLYLENRFYITFNNASPTDIKGLESASVSIQVTKKHTFQILSHNGNSLGRIQIMDIQGHCLLSEDVKSSSYTYQVKTPGMYIIRVGSAVKKVIIN
jgi:hypothetical protein